MADTVVVEGGNVSTVTIVESTIVVSEPTVSVVEVDSVSISVSEPNSISVLTIATSNTVAVVQKTVSVVTIGI